MTHYFPVREGDVVWFDGTEVEVVERAASDVFTVYVNDGTEDWHIDRFTDEALQATRIEVDSRDA